MLDADRNYSEGARLVMTPKRIDHVFMVRLWSETATGRLPPDWRGVVEHAASGQKLYFTSLDDLIAFLTEHLGTPIGPPANRAEDVTPTP
jgi:hypothetical protein